MGPVKKLFGLIVVATLLVPGRAWEDVISQPPPLDEPALSLVVSADVAATTVVSSEVGSPVLVEAASSGFRQPNSTTDTRSRM